MVSVQLPDGSKRSFEGPVSVFDVAASIGPGLAKAALGGKVDGKLVANPTYQIAIAKDKDWMLFGVAPFSVVLVTALSMLELFIAGLQALRGQDIGELAIGVFDQGDEGGAVGIVFHALDRRRLIELGALEIDQAIALLVTAALIAHHDAARVVAAALGSLALRQRLDRTALVQAGAIDQHQLTGAGSPGLIMFQCHGYRPVVMSIW